MLYYTKSPNRYISTSHVWWDKVPCLAHARCINSFTEYIESST